MLKIKKKYMHNVQRLEHLLHNKLLHIIRITKTCIKNIFKTYKLEASLSQKSTSWEHLQNVSTTLTILCTYIHVHAYFFLFFLHTLHFFRSTSDLHTLIHIIFIAILFIRLVCMMFQTTTPYMFICECSLSALYSQLYTTLIRANTVT